MYTDACMYMYTPERARNHGVKLRPSLGIVQQPEREHDVVPPLLLHPEVQLCGVAHQKPAGVDI